ncbi:hypothetical protein [Paenibacillus sp. 1-18]|uniref:hypothetical protein n=1 Tax=Paenibacillus sp. 1-18 TaxID=1333846 RepID=UPI0004728C4A|nr:hypothetical protein [Paenibacillus sp. 1-18]
MGIKRDYDGLRIDPCFPADWEEAQVFREFHGPRYEITIRNPSRLSKGQPEIQVDGSHIRGSMDE